MAKNAKKTENFMVYAHGHFSGAQKCLNPGSALAHVHDPQRLR
jgi:hypothetical protein